MTLHEDVSRLRSDGLTVKQIAKRLHVRNQTVSECLKGESGKNVRRCNTCNRPLPKDRWFNHKNCVHRQDQDPWAEAL
jgi:orotate phosphoribosyltransferase-like protein